MELRLRETKTQRAHGSSSKEGGQPPPPFLTKTLEILETPSLSDFISWGAGNDSVVVKNIDAFSTEVLPRYFKHSKFSSFVRQLHIYGFRKIHDDGHGCHEFRHQYFVRGASVDDLRAMRRQKTAGAGEGAHPTTSDSPPGGAAAGEPDDLASEPPGFAAASSSYAPALMHGSPQFAPHYQQHQLQSQREGPPPPQSDPAQFMALQQQQQQAQRLHHGSAEQPQQHFMMPATSAGGSGGVRKAGGRGVGGAANDGGQRPANPRLALPAAGGSSSSSSVPFFAPPASSASSLMPLGTHPVNAATASATAAAPASAGVLSNAGDGLAFRSHAVAPGKRRRGSSGGSSSDKLTHELKAFHRRQRDTLVRVTQLEARSVQLLADNALLFNELVSFGEQQSAVYSILRSVMEETGSGTLAASVAT